MRTYIVDTYAWIAYFDKGGKIKEVIEKNYLETPSIVLAELSRVLARRKTNEALAQKTIDFVLKRSVILPLVAQNAVRAGKVAEKEGLNLADAIIYSYVTEGKTLLSGDEHFRGKPNVEFLKE